MIIVVDALNRHKFEDILDEMFRLRARVFGERLGWDVTIEDGKEIDQFDHLNPMYGIGLDDRGNVVACVRALQTTGPHMLSDVFNAILGGEPPLRDPQVWESTRFCVDTQKLARTGDGRNNVAQITSELMIAAIETAMQAGVTDIVTVVDPVMNRVMKRSGNAPYDYLGETVPMGKVSAMAALLDCTPERVAAMRDYAGIDYDVFLSEDEARALFNRSYTLNVVEDLARSAQEASKAAPTDHSLHRYCIEQIHAARNEDERTKALALMQTLLG